VLILVAGPAIYLMGSAIYKKVVYGLIPASHIFGVLALLIAIPIGYAANLLQMGILTTVIMLVVSVWEGLNKRLRAPAMMS
ncbi:MAG TPA: hypothetical protein DFK19_19360, partial [Ochrobactrum sp.]|nr:hypothetical protein [Ochrobactrum sp.]